MFNPKLVVGIDVSKSDLDFADFCKTDHKITKEGDTKNEIKKIEKLLKGYDPLTTLIVFEPTGSYSDKLLHSCEKMGFKFSLVSPRASNYYTKALGISTKTDAQAARTLALMGATQSLALYQPSSKENKERKRLMNHLCYLEKEKQALLNKIHAEEQLVKTSKTLLKSLNRRLKQTIKEIGEVEQSLKTIKDADFEAKKKKAKTVVGVGDKVADWVLTFSDGLTNFHTSGSLKKFFGLAPNTHTSGSSVRKNQGISKAGPGKVRGCLYMAALSAIKHNKVCKDLYYRLRERGKCHFKAIVAVMAKLLVQIFAVVKSDIDFDNDYLENKAKAKKAAQEERVDQTKVELAA